MNRTSSVFIYIFFVVLTSGFFHSGLALGDERSFLLGQWSHHSEDKEKYNEVHGLVGFEYEDKGAATFINSYNDRAYMVFYSPEYYLSEYLDFRVTYGLVYGYEEYTILPVIFPGLHLKHESVPIGLDLNYLPRTAFSVGFRVDF